MSCAVKFGKAPIEFPNKEMERILFCLFGRAKRNYFPTNVLSSGRVDEQKDDDRDSRFFEYYSQSKFLLLRLLNWARKIVIIWVTLEMVTLVKSLLFLESLSIDFSCGSHLYEKTKFLYGFENIYLNVCIILNIL